MSSPGRQMISHLSHSYQVFFNLEIVAVTYSSYCPMNILDAVSKNFIKAYLLAATLLMASLINYFMSWVAHSFHPSLRRRSSLMPSDCLGVCFIRILILSYKNLATASLIFLNCVKVADVRVLLTKGDMECYQWWQTVISVFFFIWILFFSMLLKISFNMFMKDEISFPKFILCLLVPFAVVANRLLNRNVVSVDLQKSRNLSQSEVKKILIEIFEESYRLNPVDTERKLNVHKTFNLRLVTTGKIDDSGKESVFYETWRLYQRVLLAFVATFCIDPVVRITFMTPTVIIIVISYFVTKPYKPEMYILHWIKVFSILDIFICLIHNMFQSFLYVCEINYQYAATLAWQLFAILDLVFSPIFVLVCFFIIKPTCNKAKCEVIAIYITLRRRYGRSTS